MASECAWKMGLYQRTMKSWQALLLFAVLALAQSPAPPGRPQAATGTITLLVNGIPVNTGATINLKSGSGVTASATPDPAINGTDIEFDSNTTFLAVLSQIHANALLCKSANGTTGYTCALPYRALSVDYSAYQAGMTFLLWPDTSCTASCTVNIDNVGTVNIKQPDGTTDPDGLLVAGQPKWIWYDGTIMRLL
jgi:hypothetical protein